MNINVPEIDEIINALSPVNIPFEGKIYSCAQWRDYVLHEVNERRNLKGKIDIFCEFSSALLEGYGTKGENQENERRELIKNAFHNFSDITEDNITDILESNGYYLKDRGIEILLNAKKLIEPETFYWESYFSEAEMNYDKGYKQDKFLKIKGVGSSGTTSKTRDYAISQFSPYYCAIDRNLARFISRTGLVCHGYGQPDFGTHPSENYDFLQWLVIRFSKQLGWKPKSNDYYSPKALDAMFWLFSSNTGFCKAIPLCNQCPLQQNCLTFRSLN